MRILILANNDIGLYQFRKELIEKIIEYNEVIISLPYGELVEPLIELGCKFINTPIDRRGVNPIKDINLFLRYKKILKQEKPDLVLAYTIKPNIYGGLACRMMKTSYAINITGLGTAFEKEGILKKVVIIMNKISYKKAKIVFFENEENKQIFVERKIVKNEQTCRLNGAGVNLDKYQMTDYPTEEKIKFLFMGRVMAEKGIEELFKAMKMLVSDGLNCELNVVGVYEEDYKEKIKKYEAEGWLHYYGYQKDVKPYIQNCHCFVLPSWHEGMANTNLECAASGRPVITSNIPGCMESVIDNSSGFLVENRNPNDLYRAMKKFVELSYEEKKSMGISGRKYMEKVFDRKKVIDETIRMLHLVTYMNREG